MDLAHESAASRSIARSLRVLVAALILCGLYFGRALLLPLVVAILFGFVLAPLVGWLRRRGMYQSLAVTLVMLFTIGLLAGTGAFLTLQARSLANELPRYQTTINTKLRDLREEWRMPVALARLGRAFEDLQQPTPEEEAREAGTRRTPPQPVVIVGNQVPPMQQLGEMTGRILPGLAMTATFLLYLVLILLDPADLRDRAMRLLGGSLQSASDALAEAGRRVSRYLVMQVVVNVTYAVPLAVGLALLGVPGAPLWGALSAVLRFVPYVGAWLGAAFPLILALAVDPGWSLFVWTLGLILALELISNNVVEPWLYGASTGLSVMSVIVAATFWTALWGPIGLVISTPITVSMLVLGRHIEGLRFLEVLLGRRSALDPAQRFHQRLLSADAVSAQEMALAHAANHSPRDFYDAVALPVLRSAMEERIGTGHAERRHRVLGGLSATLDSLAEAFPTAVSPENAQCLLVTGAASVDRLAARMAQHALENEGIAVRTLTAPQVSASFIAQLPLRGDETVCLVHLGADALPVLEQLCRRLRRRWAHLEILVARWAGPAAAVSDEQLADWDATGAVEDIAHLVARSGVHLEREPTPESGAPADPAAEAERVASLTARGLPGRSPSGDLHQRAREIADIFDVPVARIAWVDATQVCTAGDSRRAGRGPAGREVALLPRAGTLHDRVIQRNEPLLVQDADRDPRCMGTRAETQREQRFFAGVPLRDEEGRALGVLSLEGSEPRRFVSRDLHLLEMLGRELTRALMQELTPDAQYLRRTAG